MQTPVSGLSLLLKLISPHRRGITSPSFSSFFPLLAHPSLSKNSALSMMRILFTLLNSKQGMTLPLSLFFFSLKGPLVRKGKDGPTFPHRPPPGRGVFLLPPPNSLTLPSVYFFPPMQEERHFSPSLLQRARLPSRKTSFEVAFFTKGLALFGNLVGGITDPISENCLVFFFPQRKKFQFSKPASGLWP